MRSIATTCQPRHLWDTLWAAGQDLGLRPFGMRAMMSLRLDKWFGSWGREFSPDYTPGETGLDRFIRWNKPADWIGKAAAMKEKAEGPKRKLVRLRRRCQGCRCGGVGADLAGRRGGGLLHLAAGSATTPGKSVAQGFVPARPGEGRAGVEIEILGERRPAVLVSEPLFDADGARMRG